MGQDYNHPMMPSDTLAPSRLYLTAQAIVNPASPKAQGHFSFKNPHGRGIWGEGKNRGGLDHHTLQAFIYLKQDLNKNLFIKDLRHCMAICI